MNEFTETFVEFNRYAENLSWLFLLNKPEWKGMGSYTNLVTSFHEWDFNGFIQLRQENTRIVHEARP